jgi:hypothetical protein
MLAHSDNPTEQYGATNQLRLGLPLLQMPGNLLADKLALVTGGGRGIGAAIAREMAKVRLCAVPHMRNDAACTDSSCKQQAHMLTT